MKKTPNSQLAGRVLARIHADDLTEAGGTDSTTSGSWTGNCTPTKPNNLDDIIETPSTGPKFNEDSWPS